MLCRFDVSAVFDEETGADLDDDIEDAVEPELDEDEDLEPLDAER